ncbi:MAG TPA: hypothetical protein DET40_01560 [Lentisphaeria bacterium]|nr:MAG: hypothetical protein A2X45_17160 [Lentisphaerae bacterium GWF2_50_93]HCE42220.1 hypothetical protein [Lentisphaeria bacterium]
MNSVFKLEINEDTMNSANETFEVPADAIGKMTIPRTCSWCNKIIGAAGDETKKPQAHGICPDCFKNTIFERACGIRTDRYHLVQEFHR